MALVARDLPTAGVHLKGFATKTAAQWQHPDAGQASAGLNHHSE